MTLGLPSSLVRVVSSRVESPCQGTCGARGMPPPQSMRLWGRGPGGHGSCSLCAGSPDVGTCSDQSHGGGPHPHEPSRLGLVPHAHPRALRPRHIVFGTTGAKTLPVSRGTNHFTIVVRYAVHTGAGASMYTARERDAAWWAGVRPYRPPMPSRAVLLPPWVAPHLLRGRGGGTRPRYLIVCLWRCLLASRHCSFGPSVGPNVFWLCQRMGGYGGYRGIQTHTPSPCGGLPTPALTCARWGVHLRDHVPDRGPDRGLGGGGSPASLSPRFAGNEIGWMRLAWKR